MSSDNIWEVIFPIHDSWVIDSDNLDSRANNLKEKSQTEMGIIPHSSAVYSIGFCKNRVANRENAPSTQLLNVEDNK